MKFSNLVRAALLVLSILIALLVFTQATVNMTIALPVILLVFIALYVFVDDYHSRKTMLNTIKELNEFKAALSAEQLVNFKQTSFMGNISHELRTPLNAIIGTLELLEDSSADRKITERVRRMQNASQNLLSIIDNSIELANKHQSEYEVNKEFIAVNKFLESEVETYYLTALKKGVLLNLHLDAELFTHCLNIDKFLLQQVLNNLIGNAVKYTDKGTIDVFAVVTQFEGDEVTLSIVVKDSGIGISEKDQKRIFERSKQVFDEQLGRIKGYGLELHITKNLVYLMGGDLKLKSQTGIGSEFTINLETQIKVQISDYQLLNKKRIQIFTKNLVMESVANLLFKFHAEVNLHRIVNLAPLQSSQTDIILIDSEMMDDLTYYQLKHMVKSGQIGQFIVLSELDHSDEYTLWINHLFYLPVLPSKLLTRISDALKGYQVDKEAEHVQGVSYRGPSIKNLQPSLKILCADDEQNSRETLKEQLLDLGYENVSLVDDGSKAVTLASSMEFILMDIQMKELDGISATRAIREAGYTMPIVGYTGLTSDEIKEKAIAAGMNDVLVKPVNQYKLQSCITKFLASHL